MNINDIFNASNVRDFIQGNYLALKDRLDKYGIDSYLKEQAIYRAMQCPECLINGKCFKCGCKTPAMFFAPKKSCKKEDSWGPMMEEQEWEDFKNENNIEIPLDYFNKEVDSKE